MEKEKPLTVISATRHGILSSWIQLWIYRSLLLYLFKQTALRRFRETIIGPAWLLLRPLLPSVAAIIIFTRVVPVPTDGIPYPIFYFSGFLFWGLFASVVAFVPRAMRMNRKMMKKMYFPRILIPFASLGIPFAMLAVTISVFLILVVYYSVHGAISISFRAELLFIPLLLILTIVLAISIGMVVGVFTLVAKDILFTLPYFLQVWMLVTPVLYGIELVPEQWHWVIYVFNPMAIIVEGGRWSLLGAGHINFLFVGISVCVTLAITTFATMFFLRSEDILMDDI